MRIWLFIWEIFELLVNSTKDLYSRLQKSFGTRQTPRIWIESRSCAFHSRFSSRYIALMDYFSQGDITKLELDAIVNAANKSLLGWVFNVQRLTNTQFVPVILGGGGGVYIPFVLIKFGSGLDDPKSRRSDSLCCGTEAPWGMYDPNAHLSICAFAYFCVTKAEDWMDASRANLRSPGVIICLRWCHPPNMRYHLADTCSRTRTLDTMLYTPSVPYIPRRRLKPKPDNWRRVITHVYTWRSRTP